MNNFFQHDSQYLSRVALTNKALIVIAAGTSVLSFQAFDIYMSAAGLGRWGSTLAGIMCLVLFAGYYIFWDWVSAELTDPDVRPSQRAGIIAAMVLGLVVVFGVSSLANLKTLYSSTARQLEMRYQSTEIKHKVESLHGLSSQLAALGVRLSSVSSEFSAAARAEIKFGTYSSAPGPGGVSYVFGNTAKRASDLADSIRLQLDALAYHAREIETVSVDIEQLIRNTSLTDGQRQIEFEAAMQSVRNSVIAYQGALPVSDVRVFANRLLAPVVEPALSEDADIAASQTLALRSKLPRLYRGIGEPLDQDLTKIESMLDSLALPELEALSDTELVLKWWHKGIDVFIAAFAIDCFPLIIVLIRMQGADARRSVVNDDKRTVQARYTLDELLGINHTLNRLREEDGSEPFTTHARPGRFMTRLSVTGEEHD